MNDVIIVVDKNAMAYKKCSFQKIGNEQQNLQNKLKFEFEDEIVEGQAWLEFEIDGVKKYTPMEKYDKGYQIDIKNCLLTSSQVSVDLKITQDEEHDGVPVFITNIITFDVEKTINAEEEEPDNYPDWFESANKIINEANNLNLDINKNDNVSTITINKKDGTQKSVDVYDGLSATIQVGNVTTLEPGENATVTNVGTENNAIFNFGIPKGEPGQDGSGGGGGITTESDPTVPNYVKNITEENINSWNTVGNKVDKVSGKGLSSNDYTTVEKEKLASLNNYVLPQASSTTLGGVKIGSGINQAEDGTISVSNTGGSTNTSPLNGKKISVVADSIGAGYGATTNFPTILGQNTGAIIQNLSLSGATISYNDENGYNFITTGANVDSDSDYILILGGGNDYFNQYSIGTNDSTDWSTVKGALKQIIEYYQQNIPNAKIFVSTDTPFVDDMGNNSFPYWNAIAEICSIYHIPFLNLWNNFGLNPQISQVANIYYQADLTHLTNLGNEYLADKIQKFLETETFSNTQNASSLNGYRLEILTASEYQNLPTKDSNTIYITKDQKAYLGTLQILGGDGGSEPTPPEVENYFDTANKVYEESTTNYQALSSTSYSVSANATSPAYVTFEIPGLTANTNYQLTYDVQNTNTNFDKWYFITDSNDSEILLNSDDGSTFNTGTNTKVHARIAVVDGSDVTENTCTYTNIKITEV